MPTFNPYRFSQSTWILVCEWLSCCVAFFSRKVNSFLNKMDPTEVQIAAYIDALRDKQWPESQPAAPPPPPRTEEEKNDTRDRAHNLINARCRWHFFALEGNACSFWYLNYIFILSVDSNYLVLKKTDVESVFNIFQDSEENKTLVYVSISTFTFCHHPPFTVSNFHFFMKYSIQILF